MALDELVFDIRELTIREARTLEEVSGRDRYLAVFEAMRTNTFTAADLSALALVARRREHPDATLEDIEGVKIAVANAD